MQKPNRIVWMLDETLIKSSPSHWPKIRQQTTNIVQKFGNPDMDHFLADPEPLIKKLGEKLAGKTFSCVIDLSGWMGEVLSPVINSPVITTEFSVSRIREASDPSLPTSGYISSLSRDKRVRLKFNLNRSKTLILDDTSFSGNTSLLTIKELGLNPETTTNGFLISNSGRLGNQPGASDTLNKVGSEILEGMTINTPEDDGWHVTDIWNHSKLNQAMALAVLSQEIMAQNGIKSETAQQIWFSKVFLDTQFINRIEPKEVEKLISEGRLITNNPERLLNGQIHTTNPLLWLSPYFIDHINLPILIESHQEISTELEIINSLAGKRHTPHWEAIHELKRGVEGHVFNNHLERGI